MNCIHVLVEVKDYDYICSQITYVFKMFFLPCYYTEIAQSTKQTVSLKLQHTFLYCHQERINHKKIEPLKYPAESLFRDNFGEEWAWPCLSIFLVSPITSHQRHGMQINNINTDWDVVYSNGGNIQRCDCRRKQIFIPLTLSKQFTK